MTTVSSHGHHWQTIPGNSQSVKSLLAPMQTQGQVGTIRSHSIPATTHHHYQLILQPTYLQPTPTTNNHTIHTHTRTGTCSYACTQTHISHAKTHTRIHMLTHKQTNTPLSLVVLGLPHNPLWTVPRTESPLDSGTEPHTPVEAQTRMSTSNLLCSSAKRAP